MAFYGSVFWSYFFKSIVLMYLTISNLYKNVVKIHIKFIELYKKFIF